jgi:hypothetical protein
MNQKQITRLRNLYEVEGRGMETCARLMRLPSIQIEEAVAEHKFKRATAAPVKPLDAKQVQRVRELYEDEGRGMETIARVMKVALAAVETAVVEQHMTRGTPSSIKSTVPLEVQVERVRLARHERDLLHEAAGEKSLRITLTRLVKDVAQDFPAPPAYVKPPKAKDDTVRETLVLMLSDWHMYEVVDPERVRDLNAYDATTAGRRVYSIVHSLLSIKRKMERGGGWVFPKLVVSLNGDLISGSIHEVERHSDAPSVVHAVYGAGLLLAQALRDLAGDFAEIEVFCTSGNHGRLPDARRVQQKDPLRSWDTLIAWMAKEHLSGMGDRIRWHTPNSYSVIFDVEGWNFLQTHGHDVKSWNQIPWYGINRLVGNVNALESARSVVVHHYLFGHFHTATSLPHAAGESFINGSLIGGTEFSVHGLGKADKPAQWMFGVHAEHGVTHRWPLLADLPGAVQGTYDVRPWLR